MSELFNAIYLTTPARRFVGVSLVTGLALSYAKPEIMFDKGIPRPWARITPEDEDYITATEFPWWLAATGAGLIASTFF